MTLRRNRPAILRMAMSAVFAIVLVLCPFGIAADAQSAQGVELLERYFSIKHNVSEDAAVAFLMELTLAERESFTIAMNEVTIEYIPGETVMVTHATTVGVHGEAIQPSACWARNDTNLVRSGWVNEPLFALHVYSSWCGTSAAITSASHVPSYTRYDVLWKFSHYPAIGTIWAGCVGCASITLQTTAQFNSDILGVPVQQRSPWIRTFLIGDGQSWSELGG